MLDLTHLSTSNLIAESSTITVERPQGGVNIRCGEEHGREPACSRERRLDTVRGGPNLVTGENGTAPPPYDGYMVRGDGCPGAGSRVNVFQPR